MFADILDCEGYCHDAHGRLVYTEVVLKQRVGQIEAGSMFNSVAIDDERQRLLFFAAGDDTIPIWVVAYNITFTHEFSKDAN